MLSCNYQWTGRRGRGGALLWFALLALLMVPVSVVSASPGPAQNPCAGPAGGSNPNCDEHGQFHPGGKGFPAEIDPDPGELEDLLRIHPPSVAEGIYQGVAASFAPAPTEDGVHGPVVAVNDGSSRPTEGCHPIIDLPEGAIAVIDRGTCQFGIKVVNAQAAGAVAAVVVNSDDTAPFVMHGVVDGITIPAIMVSKEHGSLVKAGLPAASGTVGQIQVPEPVNLVEVHGPSAAAGSYGATGASFGPPPTDPGVTAPLAIVDDGSAEPSLGCGPLVGFPAGSIAIVDRGSCTFVDKARNAHGAGAVALIVVNNISGPPIGMSGTASDIGIPSVMVSLADGGTINAGLPATATVRSNPHA